MSLPEWGHLIEALGPLADSDPGAEHTSDRLVREYNSWAVGRGMESVSAQQMGMALQRHTTLDAGRRHNSKVWRLTRAGLECRNWHT
jgi:hypothetical protein